MPVVEAIALALAGGGALVHVATILLVAIRLGVRSQPPPLTDAPPVTLIRPVSGLEYGLEAALETGFALSYPHFDLILCAEDEADPAVPLVRTLIAAHPEIRARLLIGRDPVGVSPKINNMVKGWKAAETDWIILSDSNALLPRDFVEGLFERWGEKTGVVSTATIGTLPGSFAAEIECAFLNSYQTRWGMAADIVGIGIVLGKTMLWRRDILERIGGLARISEAADDIAANRAVRRAGLRTRVARRTVLQALGPRTFAEMWRRQVRWAQARRIPAKGIFYSELLSVGLLPIAAMVVLTSSGFLPRVALPAFAVLWYGLEALLNAIARWPLSVRMPLAWIARDLLVPAVWVAGWFGGSMAWRGNDVDVHPTPRNDPSG